MGILVARDIDPEDVGYITGGEFRPFPPSEVKRHGIEPGRFTGGHQYLTLSGEQALDVFKSGKCLWMHQDAVWDDEILSLIHIGWWYKRHPEALLKLSEREIDRLNLREYRDSLAK